MLPVRKPRSAAVLVSARVVLVIDRGRALGHRLATGEPNAGQVELPGAGMLTSCEASDLGRVLGERFGARGAIGPVLTTIRHAITKHRITLQAHAATIRGHGDLRWFPMDAATPWTTPSRKVFRSALASDPMRQA